MIDSILGHIRSGQTRQVVQALAELPESTQEPQAQEPASPPEKDPALLQAYDILADEVSSGRMSLKEAQERIEELFGLWSDPEEELKDEQKLKAKKWDKTQTKAGLGFLGGVLAAGGGALATAATGGAALVPAAVGGLIGAGAGVHLAGREAQRELDVEKKAKEGADKRKGEFHSKGVLTALGTAGLGLGAISAYSKIKDMMAQERHRRSVLANTSPLLQAPPPGYAHYPAPVPFQVHPAHAQAHQQQHQMQQPLPVSHGMRGFLGEDIVSSTIREQLIEQVVSEVRAKRASQLQEDQATEVGRQQQAGKKGKAMTKALHDINDQATQDKQEALTQISKASAPALIF